MFFQLYCSGKLFIRYNVLPRFCLNSVVPQEGNITSCHSLHSSVNEHLSQSPPKATPTQLQDQQIGFCMLLLTPDKWKINYPKYAAQRNHNENFLGDLQPAATVTQNCIYKHRCIHTVKNNSKPCFLLICIYTETAVKAMEV